jgi:manganese/zinc/iron transport system permease protein
MNSWLSFFSDPNAQWVLWGCILSAASSAMVGSFALLRKRALVGDAISHAVLPGICLAFILHGRREFWLLFPGAIATAWLSMYCIDWIARKSRIKTDAAIALVLSVFFGFGILLLTSIQRNGNANQAGLDHFLFGQAAALLPSDLILFIVVSVVLIIAIGVAYKEFQLLSFDPDFASAMGLPVKSLEFLLSTLTVLAVVSGIQAVGVILMAALLITPAACARFWTDSLTRMLFIAAGVAALAATMGTLISYNVSKMPLGPWIIVLLSLMTFASMIFAPRKGWFSRKVQLQRHRAKIRRENVLKAIYKIGENAGDFTTAVSEQDISDHRALGPAELRRSLSQLLKRGLANRSGAKYILTETGRKEGARLTRIHRLWELYLTRYLRVAPDHVHDDAEAVEHLINPEMEAELEALLDFPSTDPHNREIPRS